MPRDEGPPDTKKVAGPPTGPAHQKSATTTDRNYGSAPARQCVSSRQVAWWPVHEFVAVWLEIVGDWPTAGTPAWCALDDRDPRKLAAILDAGRHWALRLDALQEAHADASKAISDAADWPQIAREVQQRHDFYTAKPWLKRVAS